MSRILQPVAANSVLLPGSTTSLAPVGSMLGVSPAPEPVASLTAAGTTGNDLIIGTAGDDTLLGEAGDDTLRGEAGHDLLDGGAGSDTADYATAAGAIQAELATGAVGGAAGNDTLVSLENLRGSAFNDRLAGDDGANRLEGGAGADTIIGGAGNDTLDGGAGADSMTGGLGNDTYVVDDAGDLTVESSALATEVDSVLSSVTRTLGANLENLTLTGVEAINGAGNALANVIIGNGAANNLFGGAANDTLIGGSGADTLSGGEGADRMEGGFGGDVFIVDNESDQVVEVTGQGTDRVSSSLSYTLGADVENLTLSGTANIDGTGNAGPNLIQGNAGNNRLSGLAGNDTLTGGAGNDTLDGGTGADTMVGQEGDDTYYVDSSGDVTIESYPSFGTDTVITSLSRTISTNIENMTLVGVASLAAGNALANILTGNAVDNTLLGVAGDDTLFGGAGNDTLNGGAGADRMEGGTGDDVYAVDNTLDVVVELAGEGIDRVSSIASTVLGAHVENLTLAGTAAISGTGNDLANVITGNSAANTLDGGAGADTLSGLAGDDTYVVDDAGDVVTEGAGGGTDLVLSSTGWMLGSNVENLTLTGAAAINGTGNTLANIITGNGAANRLEGGTGDDTLSGGAGADTLLGGVGNDTYFVEDANDVVTEAAIGGTDRVNSSIHWTLSPNIENLTLTGSASINGTGNALFNQIVGNAGDNVLDGGAGADTLSGGAGNDAYVVDQAGDSVVEAADQGRDLVRSIISYVLPTNVEDLQLMGSANLNGTGNALDNTLYVNTGNNVLDGGAGTDTVSYQFGAGAGITASLSLSTPQATGGSGTDTLLNLENLTGSPFDDTLTGSGDPNVMDGGAGNDVLDGAAGADTLIGGDGDDTCVVDNAADGVVEAAGGGMDHVRSSIGWTLGANLESLTLTGAGAVNGTGNELANLINGNGAANVLDGAAGDDTLVGGAGDDTYIVESAGDVVTEVADGGTDRVDSSISWTLGAHIENLTLTGAAAVNGTGNALANLINGNSATNTLNGGAGTDTLVGGAGNDTYVVDNAADVVTEDAGGGTDRVHSSIGWTLGANLENLTLTGSAAINGTGNALFNQIVGNAGNNLLNGGAGADTLSGGAGNDIYVVDQAGDSIIEGADQGRDLVRSSISYVLPANLEDLQLLGSANRNGTGNALDNTLYANTGNNVLDGGAGSDSVSYQFGASAGITLSLALSTPQATGGSGLDTLLNLESLTGSSFADTLSGSSSANVLDGGAGDDVLDGGAGSDTVRGSAGDDLGLYLASENTGRSNTYDGGTGADTLRLKFTLAELNSAPVQADIGALRTFVASHGDTTTDDGPQFQFTAFDLKASDWEDVELVATDGAIWKRAAAPVTIGTLAAPTTFTIGTNAGAAAGDGWTGGIPNGSDNWSVPDNWLDVTTPTATDRVVFNATDAGGVSRVDTTFGGTIAGWVDTGQAGHSFEFDRALQVTGAVALHTGNTAQAAALTVFDTLVTLHLTALDVGRNDAGSGTPTGFMLLNEGARLDASDVDSLSIGLSGYGSAKGVAALSGGSTMLLGRAGSPANVYVGRNYSGFYSASPVGVFDALHSGATADLHLNTLYVGASGGIGTAEGTLRWNQSEAIDANSIYFGNGGGAVGRLEVPSGGTLQLGTAADPVGTLSIADNSTGGATASAVLDFSTTNPDFTAFLGAQLSIGAAAAGSASGRLVLDSNSELHLGTSGALANLYVGRNYSGFYSASPVGVFDALQSGATVDLHLNTLYVGASGGIGTAEGTLRWNQSEAIDANSIYFGNGGGAVGRLEVPSGGTLQLGTAADPVGTLSIADNSTGGATASAVLDFSTTNPDFTAFLGAQLSIGAAAAGSASGRLVLDSNSELHLGTSGALANLYVGRNYSGFYSASPVGVFDALHSGATADLHLNTLYVGASGGIGTAEGTLRWNQSEAIDANSIYFGNGGGAVGRLEVPSGGTLQLGTAADPVGTLSIADNSTGGATASAVLDFSTTNPDFTAFLGAQLSIGAAAAGSASGRLVLDSNSELHLGTSGALANLYVGRNYSGFYSASPVGVFDALHSGATADLHLNTLYVGASGGIGTAEGTLRWNQSEAIDANSIYFGNGGGAVGRLEVPSGGTLQLGTAADPVGTLSIADNSTGGATASAVLDFSTTNPDFTAFLGAQLSIGAAAAGSASGRLVLDSNSELHLGTSGALANLYVGRNYSGFYSASPVGVFDALQSGATVDLHLNTLYVGASGGIGTALGLVFAGSGVHGTVTTLNIGTGGGATGILDVQGAALDTATLNLVSGKLDFRTSTLTVGSTATLSANTLNQSGGLLTGQTLAITDGTLNFTGGVLAVDTVSGAFTQKGGMLLPGAAGAEITVNGNYALASAGTLRVELFGSSFAAGNMQYDRLNVNGTVNLNSDAGTGGKLEVHLGYSPSVGTAFTILANDDTEAIGGRFAGLLNGASFNVAYGSQTVTFQISYTGGTGNDVLLTTTAVSGAAPSGLTVDGTAGHDVLSGSVGNDVITGGAGNDLLRGGAGVDQFRFVTTGEGVDTIADFVSGSDKIAVVAANFGLVAGGSANLVVNGNPSSGAAAFVYTSTTGSLAFDADGNGAGAAVPLALLSNRPATLLPGDIAIGP